jgi:hypothetical protein
MRVEVMECGECNYFVRDAHDGYNGYCTRYPQWVSKDIDSYCGEFKDDEED